MKENAYFLFLGEQKVKNKLGFIIAHSAKAGLCSLFFLLFLFISFSAQAQSTVTTVKKGSFSDPKIWENKRVPTSNDNVVIAHEVNLNVSEFWVGQNNGRTLTIESEGSLVGSGKLIVPAKNSKVINQGLLDVGHLQFGINGSDSAFFLNSGTAIIRNLDELQKGSIENTGSLAFYNNAILHNILFKNTLGATANFTQRVHVNVAAQIINHGTLEIQSRADDALNLNQGTFRNYGQVAVKGRLNFASGTSATTPNYLHNYKNFSANSVYMNSKSSLTNWGNLFCAYDFTNNQGIIINHPCAYIEQTTEGRTFENRNNGSVFTNNGFVNVKGNFTNIAQAVLNGTGTLHVAGHSQNSDQGKVEGTLCVYDASAVSGSKIFDEPTRNNAIIAATVQACATATAPTCPLGGKGNLECKASDDCFVFNFNGYVDNGNNTVTLTFSVITNCGNALSNIAFELPEGATAQNPKNLNGDFKYSVENGTNNPFYSVKFEATNAEGFKNGAEDAFSFTITKAQFNSLGSFQVQAKAANSVGSVTFSTEGCCTNQVEISGPEKLCSDAVQTYSVPAVAGATYKWTVPAGWAIVSGQGTNAISVKAGKNAGVITVMQGTNTCGQKRITIGAPATITSQPVNDTVATGEPASFTVEVNGTNLTYQWQVKTSPSATWTNIPNATATTLTLTSVALASKNFQYRVLVTDACGTITSEAATLKVIPRLAINVRVFLEGPYNPNSGTMATTLNQQGYLPLEQPFNFGSYGYTGTERVEAGFFANNPDIVDWVLVEVRTELDPRQIITKKACFLKKDGYVVDLDGKSLPNFLNVVAGNYFIQVNHRNHVPIISKSLVNLTAAAPLYDFGQASEKASGVFPQKKMQGVKYVMYAGDGNGDATVTTADWNECWIRDRDKTGYQNSDFNMDGIVDIIDYRFMWLPNNGKVTQTPR